MAWLLGTVVVVAVGILIAACAAVLVAVIRDGDGELE